MTVLVLKLESISLHLPPMFPGRLHYATLNPFFKITQVNIDNLNEVKQIKYYRKAKSLMTLNFLGKVA